MTRYVAFSGGVDSTALALLCPDATPVFTDTGWEFPALYAHLDRFEQQTGRAITRLQSPYPGGLPGYIADYLYAPTFGARFCTRLFKIAPLNRWLAQHLPCTLAIGLRADEPVRRGNLTHMDALTITYPLREAGMDRAACVALCRTQGLLPTYPPYMARGGCMGCFFKRASEVRAMLALVPEVVEQLQDLEETIQDTRGRFFYLFPNAGASLRDLRQQLPLLAPAAGYGDLDHDGAPCGVFCHR